MLGSLIARIRKDRNLKKVEIANQTDINIGHLSHIEQSERNPSHKALKTLCDVFDVPYEPLMHTYDIELNEEQIKYAAPYHIVYDSIPVYDNLTGFAKCTKDTRSASFAIKVPDNTMAPKFKKDEYVYVQLNTPLNNKDYGLFEFAGSYFIRRFIIRKNDLVLRTEDMDIPDLILTKSSNFTIIGKVLGSVKEDNISTTIEQEPLEEYTLKLIPKKTPKPRLSSRSKE